MSWKKAIAADYTDLILQIKNFCTKTTDTGTTVIGGSNVGDGTVYGTSSTESSVVENWTITCLSGGSIEITGNPTPDITGTHSQSGVNDGKPYYDDGTNAAWWSSANGYWYVTLIASIGTPPSDGFRLANEKPVGTWEAFGTATGVPVSTGDSLPTFSVTGATSGAKANATMLTPYSNGLLSFTILDGTIPYASGDTFTIPVVSSTAEWSAELYDISGATSPSASATSPELVLKGIGGGTDEIFVGFKGYTNSSTYWNIGIAGFTGYVDGNVWTSQPGQNDRYFCSSSTSLEFYIWMDTYSIRIVSMVGTVEEQGYAGWVLPNALPSQYDYPLFVGGTADTSSVLVSDTGSGHDSYWRPESAADSAIFLDGGSWNILNIEDRYPISDIQFQNLGYNYLGKLPTWPVTVGYFSADKIYGDLRGVYYIANQGGTISSGDVLADTQTAYFCFQNVFNTGVNQVIAYDMM